MENKLTPEQENALDWVRLYPGMLNLALDAITIALAEIRELREENARKRDAIEADRSSLCGPIENMRKALKSREWLRLGRGSYEYDDNQWRDEFSEACDALWAGIDAIAKVAADWSHCSKDSEEVASARINWKQRAEIAEARVQELEKGDPDAK